MNEQQEEKMNIVDSRHGFMYSLTNLLTNHQKYYAMIFIVTLGFALVIYGLIVEVNSQISLLSGEIEGNRLQRPLRALYENVDRHYSLTKQYIRGDKSVRNEIRKVQTIIQQDMRDLLSKQEQLEQVMMSQGKIFLNSNNDPLSIPDIGRAVGCHPGFRF